MNMKNNKHQIIPPVVQQLTASVVSIICTGFIVWPVCEYIFYSTVIFEDLELPN